MGTRVRSTDRPFGRHPTASQMGGSAVARYTASDSASTGLHRGVVRAVNDLGSPVPSDPIEVQVDGKPRSVVFDPLGYGTIEVDAPGVVHLVGVDPAVSLHTFDREWSGPDLFPAWATGSGSPERAVPAHDGLLIAEAGTLWWAGPGLPSHPVLEVDLPIRGLRARHIDLDGIIDAVAWTEERVYLLRGRLGGGYGFGAAWEAAGHTVGGADVGDLDGDGQPDLAVAWNGESSLVDVWTSDGRAGFSWLGTTPLDAPGVDLTVQDADARGVDQITVLHERGADWSRFVVAGATLVQMGPDLPALDPFPATATPYLLPTTDGNADSADEITIVAAGEIALLDVAIQEEACRFEIDDAQCDPVVDYVRDERLRFVTHADGNRDRLEDLWYVDEAGSLNGSFYFPAQRLRFGGPLLQLPLAGPLAVADADLDGSPELGLATPGRAWRWGGRARPNDTVIMWSPRTLLETTVRARVADFGLYELDGASNTNEMVIVTNENGDTRLKVVQYTPRGGPSRATRRGRTGAREGDSRRFRDVWPGRMVRPRWARLAGGCVRSGRWRGDLDAPRIPGDRGGLCAHRRRDLRDLPGRRGRGSARQPGHAAGDHRSSRVRRCRCGRGREGTTGGDVRSPVLDRLLALRG